MLSFEISEKDDYVLRSLEKISFKRGIIDYYLVFFYFRDRHP